jgi:hypothetical protein
MRRVLPFLLALGAGLVTSTPVTTAPLDADLRALAALPGEPAIVSAAGITRAETPLLTIENPSAFDPASTKLRLVIVGGLDGDEKGARAAIDAVRWMKTNAPKRIRDRWTVSALPMADPDSRARMKPYSFPPAKGFYEDPEQPESRYVWRWVAYQAPDLVVEIRGDTSPAETPDSLTAALRAPAAAALGRTETERLPASASHDDLAKALARVSARSPMHERSQNGSRARRSTSRVCWRNAIPAAPSISYIPALAWIKTLELSALTKTRRCARR